MNYLWLEWPRCLDGYELVTPRPRPLGRRGQPSRPWSRLPHEGTPDLAVRAKSERFERYQPLATDSALFRRFADHPATAEGMLDFANAFGIPSGAGQWPTEGKYSAASVDGLLSNHAALRRALDLHGIGDVSELVKRANGTWGKASVKWQIGSDGKLIHRLVPFDLIHAMWLQFALYVESGNSLLKCDRCGGPFLVGTGTGRRSTAKYCSNACKVASFKARHEA